MDFKELVRDIKKIDLDIIKDSDVRMFQNEREAVEYYNDAVKNILSGNTDIAVIKLRKVLNLSPDFDEAANLLEKVREYEASKSIGDKVHDNIRGGRQSYGKRSLPQKLNLDPRILLKIIIVIVVIALTAAGCILLINLLGKPEESQPKNTEVTYSQQEVNNLNQRIEELESSLALSETETQDALSGSEENRETIAGLVEENEKNSAMLELYRAAYLFEIEKYVSSADLVQSLDEDMYKGSEKELYSEVYAKAAAMASDSVLTIGLELYNQSDYEGALENLLKVEQYNPNHEDIGRGYFLIGRSYFELGNPAKSIEFYEKSDSAGYQYKSSILYYTGKSYQELKNYEKAREHYNTLISKYPDSSLVGYAEDRLKEMD